jgi:DivIVA domain-containing protein
MLGPDEVRAQKFTTVRGFKEGYHMAEVDLFLEKVAVSLTELLDASSGEEAPSASAAQILELAQRTADEHISKAQAQADETIGSLQYQVAALTARIDELQQIESSYRSRLKDFISSHLDEL